MDPSAADPGGISVPIYDEDPEESFVGPNGLSNFFAEESDIAELFTDGLEPYEDEEENYDGAGLLPPPLETSASQRVAQPTEATHAGTVSGHTQFRPL